MEKKRRAALWLGMALLSGLFLGAAVPEILRMGTGTYAGFFSMYGFQKFTQNGAAPGRLLPYLLICRFRIFLLLWMSTFTAVGFWFHFVYLFWLGASGGMLLALFVLRAGNEGILLFGCCIFPQWLLYASAWRKEIRLFLRRLPQERAVWAGIPAGIPGTGERMELLRIVGLCLTGCCVEACMGNWTLYIFRSLAGM